jgi:hypothetical protein
VNLHQYPLTQPTHVLVAWNDFNRSLTGQWDPRYMPYKYDHVVYAGGIISRALRHAYNALVDLDPKALPPGIDIAVSMPVCSRALLLLPPAYWLRLSLCCALKHDPLACCSIHFGCCSLWLSCSRRMPTTLALIPSGACSLLLFGSKPILTAFVSAPLVLYLSALAERPRPCCLPDRRQRLMPYSRSYKGWAPSTSCAATSRRARRVHSR